MITHTLDFVELVGEGTNHSLNMSAKAFEHILASVYPITFSCYHAVFDFKDVTTMYILTFDSWERVTYNLMHKFGEFFDTFWATVAHHRAYKD